MITVRTSPAYVNRVRQDWTANGGVYGDGGVYAVVPSNDPFAQLGPTLDLTFAGVPTDQFTAATTDGYSINLNLSSEIYQIAAQYAVWEDGVGLAQKTFAQIVTFTRASTATYFDATGTLQSAAINEARFDYDPATLLARGFLIEEARTNSIRNNTMVGAVAGTPGTLPTNWAVSGLGTLTQTVVGTGTANGVNYIDIRFNGTTSTTQLTIRFEPNGTGGIPAANGQTWAASAWGAVIAGSTSNITSNGINANLWDAGGSFVGGAVLVSINTTATLTRLSGADTIATAGTAFIQPQIFLTFNSGVAIDITLRIGLPQLEQGAFATSVIPTTTTALTRSADVASVNTLSPWFNATEGTVYAEVQHYFPSAAAQQWQLQLASTSANYYGIYKESSPANITTRVRSGGADQAFAYTTGAISANTTYKTALGYAVNDLAACTNGGTVFTDATVTLPTSITALGLGQPTYTTSVMLNGYLRRLTYYPRRLSNAELQAITT